MLAMDKISINKREEIQNKPFIFQSNILPMVVMKVPKHHEANNVIPVIKRNDESTYPPFTIFVSCSVNPYIVPLRDIIPLWDIIPLRDNSYKVSERETRRSIALFIVFTFHLSRFLHTLLFQGIPNCSQNRFEIICHVIIPKADYSIAF